MPPVEATRPLPTVMFLGDPDPAQVDVTAIPTRVEPLNRNGNDLLNILLLGSDGEITNDGFKRTDTMIVVSINRTTNSVSMLSLPRDLFVYIPAWSMQRLNLTYARGESGGWSDGTFELMRQTLMYNFGINVHYYALVDLTGFKELVDSIGGVEVAVDCAIENLALIGAEVPKAARPSSQEYFYVLDVGYYRLSGAEALWYARARDNSTDFDRGRRQQQILRAIWRKARDTGQLANLPNLWNQGMELVETNLAFEDVLGLLPIALNLNPSLIENFALVRTYHTTPWQTPDGDYVQLPNYETLRPLLEDFYQPPTDSQIVVEGARIRVFNGTTNANWDRVAAERLGWDGLVAVASGAADRTDYTDTVLIDYVGGSKGSSRGEIARILNVKPENIIISPDPNREVDFDVMLGSNYSSCTFAVLPVGQASGEG
jgi:LCP family protein required for cell wall assembly